MDVTIINEIKIEEVASLGTPDLVINTKPYTAIYTCLIAAIIMIVSKALFILGVFMLVLSALALWKFPDEKRIEFFKDCFIIYISGRKDVCQKIRYDEILEWHIKQGKTSADEFLLILEGNRYIAAPCFNSTKIFKKLNSIIPEKEANFIKKQKIQATPIKEFKLPWKK